MKDSPMTVRKERFGCDKIERKILLKQVGKKDFPLTGWDGNFSCSKLERKVIPQQIGKKNSPKSGLTKDSPKQLGTKDCLVREK